MLRDTTASASPRCEMDHGSGVQWDAFYGPKYNVVSNFCNGKTENDLVPLVWYVDMEGIRKTTVNQRSPPVTPGIYENYEVRLEWAPQEPFNSNTCLRTCLEAFQDVASSPCGHTGGEGNAMAKNGTWDVGCGNYSWSISRYEHISSSSRDFNQQTQTSLYQASSSVLAPTLLHAG
ncbi:hypothetical protein CGGC5_v016986 [Colletotrichum fructicola Nara gc5]|uniref:Uncharacterized protein n=1 Tax=Colletotrichum fructicola (strain Nara gc5) TaxID=1213859 RepID=A0A7J6ICN4_COLFN|nr:hypothetical protein CGGC5_v017108 [Colletotrichum fructicola Nara gc5]KAF4474109.1 hypothetical protein CGGC5_v016986 [Colletotrichum fructicola Nara gc5]KAF4880215.1 hypothetical protein CGCFRS4_v016084 [Colletotrichum fructicola]